MDETLRLWGENIRLRRLMLNAAGEPRTVEEAPMAQHELGARLKPSVSQATVARWERGKMEPRRHYKAQLARHLLTDARILFPMTSDAA